MKLIRNIVTALAGLTAIVMTNASLVAADDSEPVIIFAASSLSLALEQMAAAYESQRNRHVVISVASSAALARQIAAGAPASLFISANKSWVDYLRSESHISITREAEIAGNRLVLAAQPGRFQPGQSLDEYLNQLTGSRLAIGDPVTSPLGQYSISALEAAGLWLDLKDRLAPMPNAQSTVNFLKSGGAPMAIIYASAVAVDDDLITLVEIDTSTHAAITYVAISFDRRGDAFIEWLLGEEAQSILVHYKFMRLP